MERLTTRQAAARLGISPSQVRRLVDAGRLQAETETRPQGTRLFIIFPDPDAAPHAPEDAPAARTDAPPDAPATHQPRAVTVHRRRRTHKPRPRTRKRRTSTHPRGAAAGGHTRALQDEVAWLRARLEAAEVERAELRRLLVATARLDQPAGAVVPLTPDAPPPTPPPTAADSPARPPRRSVLARLRRWLRGD